MQFPGRQPCVRAPPLARAEGPGRTEGAGRWKSTSNLVLCGASTAPRATVTSPDSSTLLGRGAILKRADRLAATSAHPSRSRRIQPTYRGGELPCGAHGRTLPGDAVPKPSGGLAAAPPTAPKRFRWPSGPSSSSGNEENSTGGISGDQFFAMPCRARQPCPRMGERFPFARLASLSTLQDEESQCMEQSLALRRKFGGPQHPHGEVRAERASNHEGPGGASHPILRGPLRGRLRACESFTKLRDQA